LEKQGFLTEAWPPVSKGEEEEPATPKRGVLLGVLPFLQARNTKTGGKEPSQ
jgi:hypothetical protein